MDGFYKKHEEKHKLAQYENYMLLEYQEGLLPLKWWMNPWAAVRQLQSALDKSVACYQRLFTKNENVYCDLAWVYQHTIAEGESTNAQDHYDSAGRTKQIVRVLEDNKKKINCLISDSSVLLSQIKSLESEADLADARIAELEAECKRLRESSFVTSVKASDYETLKDKYDILKDKYTKCIVHEHMGDVIDENSVYYPPVDFIYPNEPFKPKAKKKVKRKSKPKSKNKRK